MARAVNRSLLLALGALCFSGTAAAQGGSVAGVARWAGEIGTYAEGYSISGAERRRPAATGRVYFRPTLALSSVFTVRFDFLMSTEGRTFQSSRRQSINQYGVNPQ